MRLHRASRAGSSSVNMAILIVLIVIAVLLVFSFLGVDVNGHR